MHPQLNVLTKTCLTLQDNAAADPDGATFGWAWAYFFIFYLTAVFVLVRPQEQDGPNHLGLW